MCKAANFSGHSVRKTLLLLFLISPAAYAQTTQVSATIADSGGIPYAGATLKAQLVLNGAGVTGQPVVTVSNQQQCISGGQGSAPCKMPFQGTVGPVTLDNSGSFTLSLQDNALVTPSSTQWLFSVTTTGVSVPAGFGPQACSATVTITGASQSITSSFSCPLLLRPVTAGAAGTTGQVQINNGGPLGGTPCMTLPNVITGPLNVNCDFHPIGPNPYVDLKLYGVRGGNASTTATCTSGQPTVTLAAASTFQNGDGVTLFGCGPANGMGVMPTPTVTPDIARVLTGTGYVVNAPAGSTTYNYQIVARDPNGGFTASSANGSTATGSASLGSQSVSITSASRAGNVVTVTTSSAHTLATSAMVVMTGMSDVSFNGYYQVSGSADNTHFTFISGQTTANGATTSATGGTVYWFNCNHVTYSAVTGATVGTKYYIYSDRANPGTFALIGVSQVTDGLLGNPLFFDDFGATMESGFTAFEANIPTTAPLSGSADSLTTTISSGAGTTTLTLAASAGTSVSGVSIVYDDAPNIVTAVLANPSVPLVPTAGATVNSLLDLSFNESIALGPGAWTLNDLMKLNSRSRWEGLAYPNTGSAGSFTFQSYGSGVTCNVSPCVLGLGSGGGPTMTHLVFAAKGNGQTMVMMDAGGGSPHATLEYLYFGAAGGNDKMDMNLMLRSASDGSGSGGCQCRSINFNAQQAGIGTTATPTFWAQGGFVFDKVFFSGRGGLVEPDPAGGNSLIDWGDTQGSFTPFMTVAGNRIGGVAGMGLILRNILIDTAPAPVVTYLPSVGTVNLTVQLTAVSASGQAPQVSGNPISSITDTTGGFLGGQNTGVTNGANFTDRSVQTVGTGGVGYAILPQTLANCVVSAGGGVPVGTNNYQMTVFDALGREGPLGPIFAVTTTTGNQTVTCTPPAAPVGAVQWRLYRGAFTVHGTGAVPFTQTVVDTFGFVDSAWAGSVAYSAGLASAGIGGQQLILAGGFKNTISGTFTANRAMTLPDVNGIVPVSSYQNSAYDNFNRANGGLGSNWTTITSLNAPQIASNQVSSGASSVGAFWNATVYAPDQFAQQTVTTASGTTYQGLALRVSSSAQTYYNCAAKGASSADGIYRTVSGSATLISAASQNFTYVAGDVFRCEVAGSTITYYKNGAVLVTATDSQITSGAPGFVLNNVAGVSIDNWSGGNLHPLAQLDTEQDWTLQQHFNNGATSTTQSSGDNSTKLATTAYVDAIPKTKVIGYAFGDAVTGSALTTAEVGYVTVPFACTITGWHIMSTTAETITFKVWRVNGGTALPTVANSINTSGVSLSSGTKVDSTTVTDFTSTAIAANDTLGFSLTAVTASKQVTFQLDCKTQ